MKVHASLRTLFLLLAIATAVQAKKEDDKNVVKDKEPPKVTNPPTIVITSSPTASPNTSAPVASSPVSSPVDQPSAEAEVTSASFEIKPYFVKFESNSQDPIVVNKEKLKETTEDQIKDFIEALPSDDVVRTSFDDVKVTVKLSNERRRLRILASTQTAEISGSIDFEGDTLPDEARVATILDQALKDSSFPLEVSRQGVTEGNTFVSIASEQETPETQTIGGKGNSGKTIGGIVGAFAVVGVAAFAFMQYKRRRIAKDDASYHAPPVYVEAERNSEGENFEIGLSPTFSVQESAIAGSSSTKKGFSMPMSTKVSSFSVAGNDDDFDAYSFDGSTGLGDNPNLGEQKLGEVLAMSGYTPSPVEVGATPSIAGVKDDASAFTFSKEYSFDSPSYFGGQSMAGQSIMSESIVTNGHAMTISEKKNTPNLTDNNNSDAESSVADGIEIEMDHPSDCDSESIFDGIHKETLKKEVPKSQTPTKKLDFDTTTSSFKVNICETETGPNVNRTTQKFKAKAQKESKAPVESDNSVFSNLPKFAPMPWTNRQVQKVEEKHKVTITTEQSQPTFVRSQLPIQSATRPVPKKDDDSYSSYFSSDDEEGGVEKLLNEARGDLRKNAVKKQTSTPTSSSMRNTNLGYTSRVAYNRPFNQAMTSQPIQQQMQTSNGISPSNYAAEARRNRLARLSNKGNRHENPLEQSRNTRESISNQVASLRRARLQQRTRL